MAVKTKNTLILIFLVLAALVLSALITTLTQEAVSYTHLDVYKRQRLARDKKGPPCV